MAMQLGTMDYSVISFLSFKNGVKCTGNLEANNFSSWNALTV